MIKRVRITLEGVVQGVGYRPFIHRLATNYNLTGICLNSTRGLVVEVEGPQEQVGTFSRWLKNNHPPLAQIKNIRFEYLQKKGYTEFAIKESRFEQEQSTLVSPDICICNDCLRELFSPYDRRYRYPFINCTNCGPRFSIIKDIPYDRRFTTMNVFDMCPACQAEYDDIKDRRYHAQPVSCPDCGPRLQLLDKDGQEIACARREIVPKVINCLGDGKIVLVKGIGGFHIACLASNSRAVKKIRAYKNRPFKPFALMSRSVADIRKFCRVTRLEEELLTGFQRPIVLLKRNNSICPEIAPNNNCLGFVLPYTPLHYLLLEDERIPALVMTSANAGDEPIIADEEQAVEELKGLYDYILSHNRRIYNRCDDSIAAVYCGQPVILRRARGYTPLPLNLKSRLKKEILACGPELKNTFALGKDKYVYVSQHMGDLKTVESLEIYKESVARFKKLFKVKPKIIAADLHPDYLSTRYAQSLIDEVNKNSILSIQHHEAHIAACLAEHGLRRKVIGISMDGTGYGSDNCVWGGEFFAVFKNGQEYQRLGHLKYTPLPGGDAAAHQPWRMALSYLYSAYGEQIYKLDIDFVKAIGYNKIKTITGMIKTGVNSPLSSSCGRLFEAVGALLGICQEQTYEAQSAIELEMAADHSQKSCYRYDFNTDGLAQTEGSSEFYDNNRRTKFIIDPAPLFIDMVADIKKGISAPVISGRFHNTAARFCLEACRHIKEKTKINGVVLSGGVFQNRFFTERLFVYLKRNGFEVYLPKHLPPNDGGIALGQALIGDKRCV